MTVGGGQVLIEMGVDWARDITFPISGLTGDLLTAPTIGISVGVGPIAEIQIDGSPYRRLRVSERAALSRQGRHNLYVGFRCVR